MAKSLKVTLSFKGNCKLQRSKLTANLKSSKDSKILNWVKVIKFVIQINNTNHFTKKKKKNSGKSKTTAKIGITWNPFISGVLP